MGALNSANRRGLVAFACSFARIFETNLKTQGVLPLAFTDPSTSDLIEAGDRLNVRDLATLSSGRDARCSITRDDKEIEFTCAHCFSPQQIASFPKDSALNITRAQHRDQEI